MHHLGDEEHRVQLAAIGITDNLRFRAGESLMREGESEDKLYLLRQGRVGLELRRAAGEAVCLETLSGGDVLGVSLLTPHAAHLDCRAQETVLALGIDNGCLLQKMNAYPRLGYTISMRLLETPGGSGGVEVVLPS